MSSNNFPSLSYDNEMLSLVFGVELKMKGDDCQPEGQVATIFPVLKNNGARHHIFASGRWAICSLDGKKNAAMEYLITLLLP